MAEFVSAVYDGFWWIGIVELIDYEQKDIKVKFMHPHGPTTHFYWPSRDDICFVPVDKILTRVSAPVTATGRSYNLNVKDYDNIIKRFSEYL